MSDATNQGDGGQVQDQQPGDGQQQPAQQTTTDNQGDGGQQQPGQESEPFAIFETQDAFNKRMSRAAKSALNAEAKALGFDDWQQMQSVFKPKTQTDGDGGQQQQKQPDQPSRLDMALEVGQKLNMPVALVRRLQGATIEEMEADAEALMSLVGGQATAAPTQRIPDAPNTERTVTFTRRQLQDAAFVRENKDAIMQAARAGRIVDS